MDWFGGPEEPELNHRLEHLSTADVEQRSHIKECLLSLNFAST